MSRRKIKTRPNMIDDPFENACGRAVSLLLTKLGLVREELKEPPEGIERLVRFSARDGEICVSQIKRGDSTAVIITEKIPDYEECIKTCERYETQMEAQKNRPPLKSI